MKILATSNLPLASILFNLHSEEGYSEFFDQKNIDDEIVTNCRLADTSGIDSEASIYINWGKTRGETPKSMVIETAWSGFIYTLTATTYGNTIIEYDGAFKGWLAQNLLPDMGDIVLNKMTGSYWASHWPSGFTPKTLEKIKNLIESPFKEKISPIGLNLSDLRPSESMKHRMGFEFYSFGGQMNRYGTTHGSLISGWMKSDLAHKFQEIFDKLKDQEMWRLHEGDLIPIDRDILNM